MYSRPTKIRRKLCVESVDLTLVTDEPVALLARKKKVGKIVLNKGKGNITLPNVIVHVDNKLTEMRNFRNAQTRHPGFFETVDLYTSWNSNPLYVSSPIHGCPTLLSFYGSKRQWKFIQRS